MQSLKRKKAKKPAKGKTRKPARKTTSKGQGQPGLIAVLWRRIKLLSWKQKTALAAVPALAVMMLTASIGGNGIGKALDSLPTTLSQELGLTVENVVLNGREREKRINVLSALGARKGDPILMLDLDEARTRIERLGWVKTAQIARRLPNTLEITITEHEPFALWQKDGRFNIVSESGEIADEQIESYNGKRVAHLPQVLGEGANNHAKALMALLANRPIVQNHFIAGRRMGNRRWDLILGTDTGNDIIVKLPESGVDGALVRLEALIGEQKILKKAVAAVDLRFRDRVIVKMTPEGMEKLEKANVKI